MAEKSIEKRTAMTKWPKTTNELIQEWEVHAHAEHGRTQAEAIDQGLKVKPGKYATFTLTQTKIYCDLCKWSKEG